MSHFSKSTAQSLPVFILNLLFNVCKVFARDIPFKIFGEALCGTLQILLVILKNHRLIVLFHVVSKNVSVHESLSTGTQNVNCLF